jgi:CRISPR-associated protein Csc3
MNPDAAREVHEWLVGSSGLYENIIDVAGEYDAKVDPSANCSLAAHILNAVTVGVNAFVFEAIESDADIEDEYWEDIKVLAAALALHDTNKYVREAYGFDADGNTKEAFEYYFDPEDGPGDDFDIEEFLGEGYREDLHYLVQRTEKREDSRETRGTDTKFGSLKRYCRLGDVVASVALRDGVEGVYDSLTTYFDEDTVHLVQFTELEQPVLNDLLLGTTKEVIAGEADREASGVVIGSSPDAVLYLGEGIERESLREDVKSFLPHKIDSEFSFSCKLGWNKFDYDILGEIEIPREKKKKQIREQAEGLLLSDAGGTEPFESVPDEFARYLPVLIKAIYDDNRKQYPTENLTETYESVYDSIEGGKSRKGQKVKVKLLQRLCSQYRKYETDLQILQEELEEELNQELEPKADASSTVVDRFFEGQAIPSLGSKREMCFLCGGEADTKYQKGYGVYQTQGYSRRVPPHAKYKSICEVCNLEYALLADICERTDVSTTNDLEVAYFYFDDFLGDVRLRRRRAGNVVQGDADEMDDTELTTNFVGPQYFLQPVYVLDENHRMAVVRQVMQTAREAGMKVVLGRPFTRFESADAVFRDEEATRPQELLGLDEVERFGPLPDFAADRGTDSHLRRALQLFKIMSMVGQDADFSNPYIHLDRDTFHSIADFAVVNHENATRLPDLREYFENYHEDALMDMKTVAERGIDLFGTTAYDSKYKKTKVFRETLDAILTAKSQGMEDKQFAEYVRGQVYAAANREKYAGYPDPEDVAQFVEGVQTYLQNEELTSLKKLSDWENALVNSYYYAVDQTLTN